MRKQKCKQRIFAWVFAAFALFFAVGTKGITASAEEQGYSAVLADLQKDGSFNVADYPLISDKDSDKYGSVSVIQVAEGERGDVFVYTYQPSEEYVHVEATSLSMWNEYNDKGFTAGAVASFHPQVYELELLSVDGVFAKYRIKGYQVADEGYRYYNIAAIWRAYNEELDGAEEVTVTGMAYEVGQQWCMYTLNDEYHCEMVTFNTLELKITYNGFLRFDDGIKWGDLASIHEYGTSHFVAFNAENYVIEHIYDADMSFRTVRTQEDGLGNVMEYPQTEEAHTVTLLDTQTQKYEGSGLWAKSYAWDRISTATDFIESMEAQGVSFSTAQKTEIKKSQWVFSFYESEYLRDSTVNLFIYTQVKDVAVLRVHFMDVNNKVYNLAVVADKTSSSTFPAGTGNNAFDEWFDEFLERCKGFFKGLFEKYWRYMVFVAILLIGAIVVLKLGIKVVVSALTTFFGWVGKGLLWVLSLPFRGLGLLFKKIFRRD